MITNWQEFKFERLLESLLLESKLEFSDRFKSLLLSMPNNKIKEVLLTTSDSNKDLNLVQNFIDIGQNQEEVTFIQDRRAQQILGAAPIKWKTIDGVGNRYLTFNKKDGQWVNKVIFDALGFDPDQVPHANPGTGVVGDILAETESRKTPGKIYALFKFDDKYSVINKVALVPHDDRLEKVWNLTKNPMRIGRLINSILRVAGYNATAKEIEDFVNLYKSSWDIINNAFLKFDVVSGRNIAYWYDINHYDEGGKSTLGNSCMAEVDEDYFDIYCGNPDVCSLVILYSENGKLVDGKWKSSKIRGRALLWKTDCGDQFMDRIYYNNESDVELFKQFAEKNGWWCKKIQNSSTNFTAQRGYVTKNPIYTVKLNKGVYYQYPYVDTLSYLSSGNRTLSNDRGNADRYLNDTGGSYENLDDDN